MFRHIIKNSISYANIIKFSQVPIMITHATKQQLNNINKNYVICGATLLCCCTYYSYNFVANAKIIDDEKNAFALLDACASGKSDVVKSLIENNADINAKYSNGHNALHYASMNDRVKIVKFLLENGADINAKSFSGHTALYLASMHGNVETVKLLLENGAIINNSESINGYDNIDIVRLFLEKGANINYKNFVLYQAACCGKIKVVRLLLENGADVNVTYTDGDTPLMRASLGGFVETVRLLLENGANVNARNDNGNTALDFTYEGAKANETYTSDPVFMYSNNNHYIKIIKLLSEKGGLVG